MQQTTPNPKRNRLIFLALVLLFAVPYLAAMIVYQMRDEVPVGTQTNYGQLIQPARPLAGLGFQGLDGEALNIDALSGKWLLIAVADSQCDQPCQARLYEMRQMRRALGEDRERVNRLLVLLDGNADANLDGLRQTLKDFEGTLVMTGPGDAVEQLTSQLNTGQDPSGTVENRLFIVDPRGDLMMEYPADADPVGVLKDLQRLLKLSKIG